MEEHTAELAFTLVSLPKGTAGAGSRGPSCFAEENLPIYTGQSKAGESQRLMLRNADSETLVEQELFLLTFSGTLHSCALVSQCLWKSITPCITLDFMNQVEAFG